MSTTEELRRELETEWISQHKILAWPNWLQDQLLKSRKERQAAYSQGYKDALTACQAAVASELYGHDTGDMGNRIQEAISSLPIPEAKK